MSLPSPALSRRSCGSSSMGYSHVTYSPLSSPGLNRRKQLPCRLLPQKKRVFPIESALDRPASPAGGEYDGRSRIRDKRIRDLFTTSDIRCHSAPNSPRMSYCSSAGPAGKQPQCAPAQQDAASIRRQRNASTCSAGGLQTPCHRQTQQQLQPPPPPYPGSCRSLLVGLGGGVGSQSSLLSCQSTVSYACRVQEVREISLGRHNGEPFGMKVEFVGGAFFITHVVAGSVAAYAGLKSGDEIVAINGQQLEGLPTRDVLQIIRRCEVAVRLAYRPRAVVARIREVLLMKDNGVVGLRLKKKSDGLYIDFVKLGTPAHAAGLKEGDQVLKVNGHFVTEWSMEGAMALLKSLNEQLVLLVRETLPLVAAQAQQARRCQLVAQQSSQYANLRLSRSTLASAPACGRRTPDGCSAANEAVGGEAAEEAPQLPLKSAAESAPDPEAS